jgi:sortase A
MIRKSSTVLRVTRPGFLTPVLILLAFYGLARIHGVITLHAAPRSLEANKAPEAAASGRADGDLRNIDYSLWSPARIKAYRDSLAKPSVAPLATLKIPKLRIVAPVLDGTDDLTLNRGVGRIQGTARLGEAGNIGIAGHRDSFFRGLKNIARGDKIELVTAHSTDIYVVNKVYITRPSDVNALRSGPAPEITLVTCYPFYYVGNAPQRYIVQAVRQNMRAAAKPEEDLAAN